MNIRIKHLLVGATLGALVVGPAMAAKLEFKDPVGDDNGPGTYLYPTDAVYSPGSFDITEVEITNKGKNMDFKVCVNSKLDDPWGMGVGFAVQMAFVFIDTDRAPGSGNTEGLPGG
jgi:carbohydrate-binding DOMON domain-containing protein